VAATLEGKSAQNTLRKVLKQKQEKFGDKMPPKIHIQKLAAVPKNLKTANCSTAS
jgi:hypothetical protein